MPTFQQNESAVRRCVDLVNKQSAEWVELEWWGTTAAAVGGLSVGAQVRFQIASFFTLAAGLIVRQTDYCIPIPSEAASQ
jgi:hypothetical protein